uniref:Uncharacterized protein n=1 Tax=Candidatus Kentrum sp. TUN TaxID=2126343 RepID=A0A450ZP29_9GAMM|nr:MAG: hypothetical protein BECKTUN1418F_GA0071002_10681 [Candidatus Kentron sp. TUN]VFK61427.1 MAG: hypothetical protein BECKTUN1418E_GA0071001_10661 [Candidatus Kentron sp. TUN]
MIPIGIVTIPIGITAFQIGIVTIPIRIIIILIGISVIPIRIMAYRIGIAAETAWNTAFESPFTTNNAPWKTTKTRLTCSRYDISLTGEDYVTQKAWRNATLPHCPFILRVVAVFPVTAPTCVSHHRAP